MRYFNVWGPFLAGSFLLIYPLESQTRLLARRRTTTKYYNGPWQASKIMRVQSKSDSHSRSRLRNTKHKNRAQNGILTVRCSLLMKMTCQMFCGLITFSLYGDAYFNPCGHQIRRNLICSVALHIVIYHTEFIVVHIAKYM